MKKSLVAVALLGNLAQAHQFCTTELSTLSETSKSDSDAQTIKIKVTSPLDKHEKEAMYAAGVEYIVYAGNKQYYLYGESARVQDALIGIDKISESKAVIASDKTQKSLNESVSSLGSLSNDSLLHLNVLFLKEMSEDEIAQYFENAGIHASVYSVRPSLKSAKIRVTPTEYQKVKNLPLIQYIDKTHTLGSHSIKDSRNLKSANYENITPLWNSYHLHGAGMSVGVVDGGLVRNTHVEFETNGISRVKLRDNADFADHATHVAGTITADGDNPKAEGAANLATLYSYTFLSSAFADSVTDIYNRDGVLITNHSYGYSEKTNLGEYDAEAAKQDSAVSHNPYLNIFEAAGNDGEDSAYPAYGKIKGPANSKNILTIGALNLNTSGVAAFSSNGPTLDGRIKPELCARGESIYSTGASSDSDYFWMSGTSMATPSVTGIGVLASEAYQKVSGGYDIRHDILAACMINTAVDKGRKGPDFDTGYGMVDAKATVDVIESLATTDPLIYTDSISHGQSEDLHFTLPQSGKFKATISWVDPEANPASGTALVNDIDMWLVSSSGKRYYPYTLDAAHPTALAVTSKQNHIDNNEQIEVANLPAGEYDLFINGHEIITDSQEFALVSNVSVSQDSHLDVIGPSNLHNFAKVMQTSLL